MLCENIEAIRRETGLEIPVISFVGTANSGKTTLLEQVVKALKLRGYRVAVIKHSHHSFDLDQPGKDTWRLTQAGSDIVVAASPAGLTVFENVKDNKEIPLEQIIALFSRKVDIVLTEGYKSSNTAKILVLGSAYGQEQTCYKGEVLATISPISSSTGLPQFTLDDITLVVDSLIKRAVESSRCTHPLGAADNSTNQMNQFEELLSESAAFHGHICPGQVLGVRMALLGCRGLGIEDPRKESKRLIVYVEIDRCATDAIQVVTGCKLGKRTMKYVDYGKVAATFIDLKTGTAVRVAAREDARVKAKLGQLEGCTKYEAQLSAYKELPDSELFNMEYVKVKIPVEDLPGPPCERVICHQCGEGVNDYREVRIAGKVLCRACAHGGYYQRDDEAGYDGLGVQEANAVAGKAR